MKVEILGKTTSSCACVHEQTVMRTEIITGTVEKAEGGGDKI